MSANSNRRIVAPPLPNEPVGAQEVSDYIDTMLEAAQNIQPGQMISFSMAPIVSGSDGVVRQVQMASNDPQFDQWVARYMGEEAHEEDDPNLCVECNQSPCVWDQHVEDIALMTDPMMAANQTHRSIRYNVYRYMSRVCDGVLGKGVRRELPRCVVNEIHDTWPTSNGSGYTGFRASGEETTEDGA